MWSDIFNVSSFILSGGLITWIALAIFAPSVLTVVSSWLTALAPLVKGAAEAAVAFFKLFIDGMKDMLDNFASIVFVSTIAILSAWFFSCSPTKTDCKKCVDELRKEYKFVRKPQSNTGKGFSLPDLRLW